MNALFVYVFSNYTKPRIIETRWKIWHPQGNPTCSDLYNCHENVGATLAVALFVFPHEEHIR